MKHNSRIRWFGSWFVSEYAEYVEEYANPYVTKKRIPYKALPDLAFSIKEYAEYAEYDKTERKQLY